MSQGNKTSLLVNLPKANAKFAEKIWKDFSKQFKGEYKKDKKNEEYFTDNAMIVGIGGANTVDLSLKSFELTNAPPKSIQRVAVVFSPL